MKLKHANGVIPCPLCEEKLNTAHPALALWFNETVKVKYPDCHISWAFRDQANQNAAFAEGKSQLAWPNSKHNVLDSEGKPCAEAIDLFQIASNGMAVWSWKYFKEISLLMPDGIKWGGSWQKFPDTPHYELG